MGTTNFSDLASEAGVSAATVAATTSATIGGGTAITKIVRGTVAVDPLSLDTVTAADLAVTITGAAVGDAVILNPAAAGLTAGLFATDVWVSATDTVKIRFYNGSGGTINEASALWNYTLIRS